MGRFLHSSIAGPRSLVFALLCSPLLTTPIYAGIAPVTPSDSPTSPSSLALSDQSQAAREMVLPDPSSPGAMVNVSDPELTIPQFSSDVTVASAPQKDNPNAIPLPPALQSGLTGLAALGLAGGLRRLRRVFR